MLMLPYIFSSSRQMGAGVVARDHSGTCLAACGERYDDVVTPELAEALAVRLSTFTLDGCWCFLRAGGGLSEDCHCLRLFISDTANKIQGDGLLSLWFCH
jgi:hypothetical protein